MKRARRAPFVVTFAVAAMASTGCGGSTDSDPGDGTGGVGTGGSSTGGTGAGGAGGSGATGGYNPGGGGYGANPPGFPCPTELPAEGSACPQGWYWGNSCAFVDPCGGPEPFYAECNQETATWHLLGDTDCACPDSPPSIGTPCSTSSQMCSYPSTCCPLAYQCVEGVWSEVGVSCNPPPIICPETPPANGAPCPTTCSFGQCNWNECNGPNSQTAIGSCVNGAWQITPTPCTGADSGSAS